MKTIKDLQKSGDIFADVLRILKQHDDRINVLEGHPTPGPVLGTPFKNMLGINGYAWDNTQDPDLHNIGITDRIFEPKFAMLNVFSQFRFYVDWMFVEDRPGQYSFAPARRGSWDLDLILTRWAAEGKDLLFCLKEPPNWLFETWPVPHDKENIPAPYGSNLEDPASYIAQAKAAFQVAGRYGFNKDIPANLISVNTKPRWTHDPVNEVKIGMGILKYIEADNERDRWWLKDKRGFQTGRQYAAHLSAFYDGHQGKLGPGVGVKTADPNMIVVMGGLADPSIEYVEEMIEWCNENRGGSLCWDVINYHHYSNDADSSGQWDVAATRGMAPELSNIGFKAKEFVELGKKLNQPVWVTETGYDVLPTPQATKVIGNRSAEQVQADWILRTSLLYARLGIQKVFYYQMFDDNPGSGVQYSSSGFGIFNDKEKRARPSLNLIDLVTETIGNYSYLNTLKHEPEVDLYVNGNDQAYVLWVADEKGRELDYNLNGKTIKVTESPLIIKV